MPHPIFQELDTNLEELHNETLSKTNPVPMAILNGPNLDSFGRFRVSNPRLQLSAIFDTADRTLFWDQQLTGAGTATFNGPGGAYTLAVTGASGDKVVRQTKEFFSYRAGQSQLILVTFLLNSPKANLRQRVGYFFDDGTVIADGIYLEQNGTSEPRLIIQSSVTNGAASPEFDIAEQSDWNKDKLDGTGRSGITIDLTKQQILVIDFQWLGVGRVRVGFDIAGEIIYAHEFNHANLPGVLPYIKTPRLPVRFEIENTGVTSGASSLSQICAAVIREGAEEEPATRRAIYTSFSGTSTATTTLRTLLGVRLNSSNIRASVRPLEVGLANIGTNMTSWILCMNPTLGSSPTWAALPGADTITEFTRSQATVTIDANGLPTTGVVIATGSTPGGQANQGNFIQGTINDSIPITSSMAGVADQLFLCVQSTSQSPTVIGHLAFKEVR